MTFFFSSTHSLQVLGLLVWTLIAGTEYFLYPAFGWVMFVAVFYWVLTVFFLIIYMTMTYTRIPQVPWTTVVSMHSLYFGGLFWLYSIWDTGESKTPMHSLIVIKEPLMCLILISAEHLSISLGPGCYKIIHLKLDLLQITSSHIQYIKEGQYNWKPV